MVAEFFCGRNSHFTFYVHNCPNRLHAPMMLYQLTNDNRTSIFELDLTVFDYLCYVSGIFHVITAGAPGPQVWHVQVL